MKINLSKFRSISLHSLFYLASCFVGTALLTVPFIIVVSSFTHDATVLLKGILMILFLCISSAIFALPSHLICISIILTKNIRSSKYFILMGIINASFALFINYLIKYYRSTEGIAESFESMPFFLAITSLSGILAGACYHKLYIKHLAKISKE